MIQRWWVRGKLVLVLGFAFASSGCATIVSGTSDEVKLLSTPPGATVEIQGKVVETPATVELSRSIFNRPKATARLPGYEPAKFEVPREFDLWTIGNVVTLFLGLPIDVLSGAFLSYVDEYHVLLHEKTEDE